MSFQPGAEYRGGRPVREFRGRMPAPREGVRRGVSAAETHEGTDDARRLVAAERAP